MYGARGGTAVLVSPKTGMHGYPSYTIDGIFVRTLFNPSILFQSTIEVQSELTPACGIWAVQRLDHDLDSLVPHGKWFSSINAYPLGVTPPPGVV
jgi:hypothetical protein